MSPLAQNVDVLERWLQNSEGGHPIADPYCYVALLDTVLGYIEELLAMDQEGGYGCRSDGFDEHEAIEQRVPEFRARVNAQRARLL